MSTNGGRTEPANRRDPEEHRVNATVPARPRPFTQRRWPAAAAGAVLLTVAAVPSVAAADGIDLPPVPTAVDRDKPCTAASSTVARAVPWAQQSLDLTHVWKLGQGAGVTVAVVGTGVSGTAPTLSGQVSALGDAGTDCVGHGTFLAGLIAARPSAGQGFSGIAPRARILAVRGTGERGEPDAGRLAAGITAAADAGAKVIVVGTALAKETPALRAAVRHAVDKDALVVAPAAPETSSPDAAPAPAYPAALPGVLSVVDTGPEGVRPQNAPVPERADLSAPGDGMVSVGPRGGGHWTASGSAEAAAVVGGAAALVRAYHPELTGAEVRDRLLATAYPGAQPALDVYAAVSAVQPPSARPERPVGPRTVAVPAAVVGGGARHTALLVAGGAAGVLVLSVVLMTVVPRGRARRWRPGTFGA